jgi:Cdc6-like AAA superfamily ATPase
MYDYKNPFAEYNSNVMSSEQIAELFAEPFDLFDIMASDIEKEKSSIVFIGGRGTGKTMLLRQFSYNVQKVSLQGRLSFLDKVRENKFLGIYFRVDNPLLKSLDSISMYSSEPNFAEKVFTHYLELTVFKEYLEIVKIFISDSGFEKGSKIYSNILKDLIDLLTYPEVSVISDMDELLSFVVSQINYIWKYQSEKAIDVDGAINFFPSCGMKFQGRLTNDFLKTSVMRCFGLDDLSVLLLIDEFENFSEKQQQVLNTAMRFATDNGVRFRIGMRPNGFKAVGTLDNTDFVKEGRDYRKVELDFPFIRKGAEKYSELVKKIANKRLAIVPHFHSKSIDEFLGKTENIEEEAKEITRGRSKHIEEYLRLINNSHKNVLTIDDLSLLRNENPLYEMENLRLLLKGETLEYVNKAFSDYLNGVESEEQKKYSNDYDKKYKLSFVFILCTIYHIEKKKYYSFSDYCQLSSGIVGCFIELCRKAFDLAYFKNRDILFEGSISKNIQTDAAYECAHSEREMIQRISAYGGKLKIFIDNIGNAFGHIHRDMYIRYPETNLFPVVSDSLTVENKKLLEVACTWSLLIKKPNTQDAKGKSQKQDIYFLNRVLAPVYKISYRTRGGFSPISVDDSYFEITFDPKSVLKQKKNNIIRDESDQMSLFFQINIEDSENDIYIDERED